MELRLPASSLGDFARRAAPIAGLGALVTSAGYVATHNPASPGSLFPVCAFHQATGLWCPGCGLTRGLYQLLHGHVGAAVGSNIFTPIAIVAIALVWTSWMRVSWGGRPIQVSSRAARVLAVTMPTLLVAYGVMRNLPVAPLRALAP